MPYRPLLCAYTVDILAHKQLGYSYSGVGIVQNLLGEVRAAAIVRRLDPREFVPWERGAAQAGGSGEWRRAYFHYLRRFGGKTPEEAFKMANEYQP